MFDISWSSVECYCLTSSLRRKVSNPSNCEPVVGHHRIVVVMHLWLILSVIAMHLLHWIWPTCKLMIHLWQHFPPSKGPMQTAPQPAAKQKGLCDDQVHIQGISIFRYLHTFCNNVLFMYMSDAIHTTRVIYGNNM